MNAILFRRSSLFDINCHFDINEKSAKKKIITINDEIMIKRNFVKLQYDDARRLLSTNSEDSLSVNV